MVMAQPRHRAAGPAGPADGLWRGASQVVEADAVVDGVARGWARSLLWLPVAGTILLGIIYLADKWGFYWVLREDHPVEWIQFTLLLVAGAVALLAAGRFARQRRPVLAVLLLLVAFTAFVMAGEEISWGQRVFGWKTTGVMARDNRQGETNIHNLDTGLPIAADDLSNDLELLMGLGGLALGLLARPLRARLYRTVVWELSPPLFAVPGFALMALYQLFMAVTGTGAAPAIVYQEWAELCFYGSIAITVGCVYARAAHTRVTVERVRGRVLRRRVPGVPAGLTPVVVIAALAVVVTVAFAVMSTWSGLMPGNVPGSLAS